MNTAIIILNYNDFTTTKEMIEQIKDYKILNHIIIVDNCSTDDSYNILKKEEKNNIEVIKTKSNNGYASGNNYGIKYAINKYKSDYIIISNPDIIVKEKDIKALIKENINYFHKYAEKDLMYDKSKYKSKITEVEVVKGCFFIIKSNVIKDVNYFDENTFLYYEENILGKKLKDKKYKSFILNEVEVIHNLSVSVDKSIKSLKKYKILKESQRYYEKNYNNTNIFGMLLLYLTYYISYFISLIMSLFRR